MELTKENSEKIILSALHLLDAGIDYFNKGKNNNSFPINKVVERDRAIRISEKLKILLTTKEMCENTGDLQTVKTSLFNIAKDFTSDKKTVLFFQDLEKTLTFHKIKEKTLTEKKMFSFIDNNFKLFHIN